MYLRKSYLVTTCTCRYLKLSIRITNPTEEDAEEIHHFCMMVCKTVVDTLISALELHAHTKKTKFQLGFYCSGSFQADSQPHFCRLSNQRKINPKTFASSDSPHCQDQCCLPPESTIWLEQWKVCCSLLFGSLLVYKCLHYNIVKVYNSFISCRTRKILETKVMLVSSD